MAELINQLITSEKKKNRWPKAANGDTIHKDPRIACLWFGEMIISATVGGF